ncbi:hypothetical protein ABBQ38_013147 [Trebouxia sp. C0009 RCD-2024]
MERPHATRITLNSDAAFKEISNCDAFCSQFGYSFQAIKAAHVHAQACGAHHSSVEEIGVRKRGPIWTSTKKLRVPLGFSLQDWDDGTLDDMGQYTPESDIYQIGVMLPKSLCLSADSRAFAYKLKSKSISAAEAAEDAYFL